MTRFMNYHLLLCALILFAFCLMGPQTSFANSPQDVKLSYDSKSQMLAVTITHKSSSPNFHYIKSVEIKKNGNALSTNRYEKQPDVATFTYSYVVPVTAGDALEVTASCSLFGSGTTNLTIEK